MSDETSTTKTSRARKTEVIEDAIVVDPVDTVVAQDAAVVEPAAVPVGLEPAHATQTEPVVATTDAGAVALAPAQGSQPAEGPAPTRQVIYVQTPMAPKKAGNRGVGSLLALLSALIYAVAFAIVVIVILAIQVGRVSFEFIGQPAFYVPVLFYVIGLVLLVLVLNRAGWAAYVFGSIVVGLLVYFGTIGVLVLGRGAVLMTPTDAGALFSSALRDPFVIAAALVAREVSLWTGALISRRGRKVKTRNADARSAYDSELASKRAENERVDQPAS